MADMEYKGKKGFYVYGVATGKEYRGKGISTKLLEYAKGFVDEKKADFLVLVPRNEGLFEFYVKRGFFRKYCVKTEIFDREELKKLAGNTAIIGIGQLRMIGMQCVGIVRTDHKAVGKHTGKVIAAVRLPANA